MEKILNKILLSLILLLSSLLATVTNEYPSQQILDVKTPIVDIRTPPEWIETGLIQGAIPIMFFDEKGAYDVKAFLEELSKKVDTTKPFALICKTGSRTKIISNFLSSEFGYKVINLQGGMVFVKAKNLPTTPYKK
ncbi:rhodanese-like domain-containing protein [bacterium]|nr:rhodanese-like domain-containing protein [bacterium]MBU1994736.1 rhodanese-like domain-containing protein [bacterium]